MKGLGLRVSRVRPVYPGDTIKCNLTITDIDKKGRAKADVLFTNGDGLTVLKAVLTGIVPGEPEMRILSDMLREGDPTNKATL